MEGIRPGGALTWGALGLEDSGPGGACRPEVLDRGRRRKMPIFTSRWRQSSVSCPAFGTGGAQRTIFRLK